MLYITRACWASNGVPQDGAEWSLALGATIFTLIADVATAPIQLLGACVAFVRAQPRRKGKR